MGLARVPGVRRGAPCGRTVTGEPQQAHYSGAFTSRPAFPKGKSGEIPEHTHIMYCTKFEMNI